MKCRGGWGLRQTFCVQIRFHQGFETTGVEGVRSIFSHDGKNFFKWQGVAIRTLGTQGVENVGDSHDARRQSELVRGQTSPVAFAIEAFMVSGRVVAEISKSGDAAENLVREIGVAANGVHFLRSELSGLFEDGVGDTELANIVQKAGVAQALEVLFAKAEPFADVHGSVGDTVGVLIGERRFGVDDFSESDADVVDGFFIRGEAAISGLHGENFSVEILIVEPFPEPPATAKGDGGLDEAGAEPAIAAAADGINGVFLTASAKEDFDGLRQVGDVREDGNFAAPEAVRVPATVPMFVETVNARGDPFGKTELAGDLGTTFTANLHKFTRIALLSGGDLNYLPNALGIRGRSGDMSERVVEALPADFGPIHGLQIAFGPKIIGVEDVIEAGGVAAAASVFQKERVVKIGLVFNFEADFLGDAHANDATADGMAHFAAFGEVQRVREGGEQLGDTDRAGRDWLRSGLRASKGAKSGEVLELLGQSWSHAQKPPALQECAWLKFLSRRGGELRASAVRLSKAPLCQQNNLDP